MSESLVTIGKYPDVTEAQIAAGRLQSDGIPVYPLNINHLSANPLPGVGSGGVRLQVPEGFEQEARRLLSNQESDGVALNYLATGDQSALEETQDDHAALGVFRIRSWFRRQAFWVCFVSFDIVVISLVLVAFFG
jgi:hypothetical protein